MTTVFVNTMDEAESLLSKFEFINAVVLYVEKVTNVAFPTAYPNEIYTSEEFSFVHVPKAGMNYEIGLTPAQIKKQNNGTKPLSIIMRCHHSS